MRLARLCVFLAPLFLAGCMLGPDYQRPELDVPAAYQQPVEQGASFANMPWWELFGDPVLEELIRVALAENQTWALRRQESTSIALFWVSPSRTSIRR